MDPQTTDSKHKMKKFLIIVLILAAGAASYGFYLYKKPRAGASEMKTAFVVDAKSIFSEFSTNENEANKKYLGKAIEVSGSVKTIDLDEHGAMNVSIETGELGAVSCQFEKKEKMPTVIPGDMVRVKGVCTGFLLDVVLVDCEMETENSASK